MNFNTDFFVLGGDARQIYLADYLEREGYSVERCALGKQSPCSLEKMNGCANIVLPLPLSKDGENINTPLASGNIPIAELLKRLSKNQTVFCGMANEKFKANLNENGIKYIDYFSDGKLTEKNALLTAEGLLAVVKDNTVKAMAQSNCLITGYGFVGKAVASLFKGLFASVCVCVRRSEAARLAESDGFNAVLLSGLDGKAGETDLIINTVPSVIIKKDTLDLLNENCVIIDVASAPYGVDFEYAQSKNIKALTAASLPGRYTPKSAGEVIAHTITQKIASPGGAY